MVWIPSRCSLCASIVGKAAAQWQSTSMAHRWCQSQAPASPVKGSHMEDDVKEHGETYQSCWKGWTRWIDVWFTLKATAYVLCGEGSWLCGRAHSWHTESPRLNPLLKGSQVEAKVKALNPRLTAPLLSDGPIAWLRGRAESYRFILLCLPAASKSQVLSKSILIAVYSCLGWLFPAVIMVCWHVLSPLGNDYFIKLFSVSPSLLCHHEQKLRRVIFIFILYRYTHTHTQNLYTGHLLKSWWLLPGLWEVVACKQKYNRVDNRQV